MGVSTASQFEERAPSERSSQINSKLLSDLKHIVGNGHVLTSPSSTSRFRKGFRFGDGPALAVVRPGSLVEHWRVLNACISAGKIVLVC